MCERSRMLVAITVVLLYSTQSSEAVVVQSSDEPGGPDAAELAAVIADPASNYFVVPDSENTTINAEEDPNSNPRAMAGGGPEMASGFSTEALEELNSSTLTAHSADTDGDGDFDSDDRDYWVQFYSAE